MLLLAFVLAQPVRARVAFPIVEPGFGTARAVGYSPGGAFFAGGDFEDTVDLDPSSAWPYGRAPDSATPFSPSTPVTARSAGPSPSGPPPRPAPASTRAPASPPAMASNAVDFQRGQGEVVHDGALAARTHALAFDASALPPGVCVVRVAGGGRVTSRRRVVAR